MRLHLFSLITQNYIYVIKYRTIFYIMISLTISLSCYDVRDFNQVVRSKNRSKLYIVNQQLKEFVFLRIGVFKGSIQHCQRVFFSIPRRFCNRVINRFPFYPSITLMHFTICPRRIFGKLF